MKSGDGMAWLSQQPGSAVKGRKRQHMQNEDQKQGAPSTNEPKAQTGNASNPTADRDASPGGPEGLLDARADKYIREVAPIEDVPDDEDQQDMDETIRKAGEGS